MISSITILKFSAIFSGISTLFAFLCFRFIYTRPSMEKILETTQFSVTKLSEECWSNINSMGKRIDSLNEHVNTLKPGSIANEATHLLEIKLSELDRQLEEMGDGFQHLSAINDQRWKSKSDLENALEIVLDGKLDTETNCSLWKKIQRTMELLTR